MKIITNSKDNRYLDECINFGFKWYGPIKHQSLEEISKHYHDTLDDKFPIKRVLLINDTLIGFYEVSEKDEVYNRPYTPYLANLYVREEYRHQGYAKILIEDFINFCHELGYDKLYLHSGHVGFYEKFGFKFLEEVDTDFGKKRIFVYESK